MKENEELKEILTCHVICCNESIEYVVVGDKNKAYQKLKELEQKAMEIRETWYRNNLPNLEEASTWYRWHIYTVNGEVSY